MPEVVCVETGPTRGDQLTPTHTHPLTGAETEDHSDSDQKALGVMGLVQRDTALLLRDLRLGASSWLNSFLELGGQKSHLKSVPKTGEWHPSLTNPSSMARRDSLAPEVLGRQGAGPWALRVAEITFLAPCHKALVYILEIQNF